MSAPEIETPVNEPIDVNPRAEDVIAFPTGLPGFESCRRFVVMSREDAAPLCWLQGLDEPRPAFLAIDPALVLENYRMRLGPADHQRLDAREDDPLLWLAIVTIASDDTATVNLRAPIVINPRRMMGFQVVPHESLYPLRHPLSF